MKQLDQSTLIKIIVGGAAFLVCSYRAPAQVLAYESFDYYNTATIALHNASATTVRHSETSLGWAGDWQVSGANTAIPGYNINTIPSPTYSDGARDLVTAGTYLEGGLNVGTTAGRRLQTSTAGPFGTPTNFLTTNHPSTSGLIGRNGTTLWMSVMFKKNNGGNNRGMWLSLHKNTNVFDEATGNHIAVGYFGPDSNTGSDKYWTLRVNGTFHKSGTMVNIGSFSLLVISITFNSVTGNTIRLYVNPPTIGINPAPAAPILTVTTTGGVDNTFHSVGHYGGGSTLETATDEIRFGADYASATLSSSTVRTVGSVCMGTRGNNIFPHGDFGNITGVNETVATVSDWTSPTPVTFKRAVLPWSNLAPGYAYRLDSADRPGDGQYTIATGIRNIFGSFTHPVTGVPVPIWTTKNTDGFAMIVNATHAPGRFYEQTITGLCENMKYEFSVDIINLHFAGINTISNPNGVVMEDFGSLSFTHFICDPATEPGCQQFGSSAATNTSVKCGTCEAYSLNPEIEFLINDTVVYSPPTSIPNDENWHRVGFTFFSKAGVTSLKLSIRNTAPGGPGNDLALDNISLRPCGPSVSLVYNNNCSAPNINSNLTSGEFTTPRYRWQKSNTTAGPWSEISGETSANYVPKMSQVAINDLVRALVANSDANVINDKCRIASSPITITCPLPVDLLAFKATRQAEGVRINWQTSKETNSAYFLLERSADGVSFQPLCRLAAKGESASLQSYHCLDQAPLVGTNYYRLKVVDLDESFQYSGVESIVYQQNQSLALQLRPNPARERVSVVLGGEIKGGEAVVIRVSTLQGVVHRTFRVRVEEAGKEVVLSTQGLGDGVWLVEVVTARGKAVQKLSIAK